MCGEPGEEDAWDELPAWEIRRLARVWRSSSRATSCPRAVDGLGLDPLLPDVLVTWGGHRAVELEVDGAEELDARTIQMRAHGR